MARLVWYRADLRTHDHPALHHAVQAGESSANPVVAVFLLAPDQWKEHDWADIRVNFLLRNLRELSQALDQLHIPLLIRRADRFDQAPETLLQVARDHDCDAIYFNREYELNEAKRDEAVREVFEAQGRSVHMFHDQCIIAPGEIRTQQGDTYTVYTPFRKRWTTYFKEERDLQPLPRPRPRPRNGKKVVATPDDVPPTLDPFTDHDREDLWPGGETAALKRLKAFINHRASDYADQRDQPAMNGTSTMSPYLALGVVSANQCLEAALDANQNRIDSGRKGVTTWIGELIWREFYRHLIERFPRLCMHQPFKRDTDEITWSNDDSTFEAWANGRTGYPIVDAAMRQLNQTGWMHNRLRMVTAMFLTKDLLIDWRRGERYFMRHLIDGDLANNNGGWQWSASTGTDAAPYFRIFNPASQAKRYDPDGRFIRRFLPELAGCDTKALHDPTRLTDEERANAEYPKPIVDHHAARLRAIDAFKAIRA